MVAITQSRKDFLELSESDII